MSSTSNRLTNLLADGAIDHGDLLNQLPWELLLDKELSLLLFFGGAPSPLNGLYRCPFDLIEMTQVSPVLEVV